VAKRTIGFDDYEGDQYDEYTGEDPRIGSWYTGEVVKGKYDEDKDQMIWFIKLVDHPDYEGWVKGFYAPFDGGGKFKSQDFARAIQGGQKKPLSFDPEVEAQIATIVKKAPRIKFRTGDYNDRVTIEKVRALLEAVGSGKTTSTKAAAVEAAPDPNDDEELEDYTEEELLALSPDELEQILAEEFEFADEDIPELTARQAKLDKDGSKLKKLLADAILEAQAEDADDPDAEDGAADGEFSDGFEEDPAPEPEPAKPAARRSRAKAAAPAAEPEPAPTTRTRRARR
jgi:hypothetical protein